jgi:hypothetical protein
VVPEPEIENKPEVCSKEIIPFQPDDSFRTKFRMVKVKRFTL